MAGRLLRSPSSSHRALRTLISKANSLFLLWINLKLEGQQKLLNQNGDANFWEYLKREQSYTKRQAPPATPWDHKFTGFPDGSCALIAQVKSLTQCTPSSWHGEDAQRISGSLTQTQ